MKAWEQLNEWERAEALEGAAGSIRINGAQHHDEIDRVLCGRCESGLVYRRRSGNGALTVLCGRYEPSRPVPPDIAECSRFRPEVDLAMSLEEMGKRALTVDPREPAPGKHTYL